MLATDVRRLRLAAQGLTGPPAPSGVEAVRRLLAVQSQEHAHALWSLALRSPGRSYAGLAAEFDEGAFLRTHVLRPTWHFLAAEDLRWVLATTSPRVHRVNSSTYRRIGLDEAARDRGARVIVEALGASGRHLTRPELADALSAAGLPATGLHLVSLVMHAELEGLICSGRVRGRQHTYALVEERVPPGSPTAADLPELARRFVLGHGPASVRDLCRWASLTQIQAKAAFAELGDELTSIEVDGTALWVDPRALTAPAEPEVARVLLLPLYDEMPLSYLELGFPVAPDHPHQAGEDLFVGSVVADGLNLGLWRREVRGRTVEVALDLAPSTTPARRAGAERAAADLADFLALDLVLTSTAGPARLE